MKSIDEKFEKAIRQLRAEGIEPDENAIIERVTPWLSEDEKNEATLIGLMEIRDDVAAKLEQIRRRPKPAPKR